MAKVQIFITSRRLGKTMTFRLLIFSALLLAQIGVTPSGAQAASQINETVALAVGASKTIALSENPSTGYRWQLNTAQSSNLAIVRVIDAGYQAGRSGLIGEPGSHRWRIQAQAPGTATIVFASSRPWEHGAPAETYIVEVDVTPGQ